MRARLRYVCDILKPSASPSAGDSRGRTARVQLDEVQQKLLQEITALRAENETLKRLVKELSPPKVDSPAR